MPPPPGFGPGGRGGPPPEADADPSRIRIDLRPIRSEMIRQLVPEGTWEKLSAEERQKVFDEVNQRVLGFVQGIKMGAAEVQKKAQEAQRESTARAAAAARIAAATPAASPAATSTELPPSAPPAVPKAPASPKAPPTPSSSVSARGTAPVPPPVAPTPPVPAVTRVATGAQRTTNITGSRIDVTVERNGQLRQLNAEINLDNLLGTVFSNTRRDRGEVAFAVNADGHLYTPTDADKRVVLGFGEAAKPATATGTTVLPSWIVVTTADPSGTGLKFGIARPVGDSMADLRRSSARTAALGLGFIGLALIGIVPISTRLTRNLSTLSEGVRRIAHGDYHARVTVKTKDEFGELASAFNQMAEDVEKHQRSAVEQERIKRELELGRQIQHDMLPHAPLKQGLTEIRGVSVPAREVGGDFFNYFVLPSGQIALLVGDVSGKGVGAALLMANIQASLRTRLALGQDLAALAREIDGDIESNTPGPVYATLFVGILNPADRVLRYVNAGHNPQYVLRSDGGLERMTSSGLPVGLIAGRGYSEQRVQLAAGDLLFFYTDGCVEAENEAGEMFTNERLEALLIEATVDGTVDVLARVEGVVTTFRGRQEPFDDATMMAVKVG
jgi:serine phosphatase RsbU (regulator of sigma subunit)